MQRGIPHHDRHRGPRLLAGGFLFLAVAVPTLTGGRGPDTAAAPSPPPALMSGDRRCVDCHEPARNGLAAHPIGVWLGSSAPRPAGADELPTPGGRIACETCHIPHGSESDSSPSGRFRLRRQPPELCAACHRDPSGSWGHPHLTYTDTIHGGTQLAGLEVTSGAGVDAISRQCLTCHDGTLTAARGGVSMSPGSIGSTHPIGVAIPAEGVAGQQYRSAAARPAELRFFDGRVGCATCHRLYGRAAFELAVTNDGNLLCMGCHSY